MENRSVRITTQYVSIENYNSVKDIATSKQKDELINELLKATVDYDLCDNKITVSELQAQILNSWIRIRRQKSQCENLDEIFSTFLARFFPNALGKITSKEVILFSKLVSCLNNVKIGFVKQMPLSKLEVWVICENKDYSILEQATEIINEYIIKNKTDVNCIFIGKNQLAIIPNFVMQI